MRRTVLKQTFHNFVVVDEEKFLENADSNCVVERLDEKDTICLSSFKDETKHDKIYFPNVQVALEFAEKLTKKFHKKYTAKKLFDEIIIEDADPQEYLKVMKGLK